MLQGRPLTKNTMKPELKWLGLLYPRTFLKYLTRLFGKRPDLLPGALVGRGHTLFHCSSIKAAFGNSL